MDRFLFYSVLATITLVALPLGSNRPWAWSLLELTIFGIGIVFASCKMLQAKRRAKREIYSISISPLIVPAFVLLQVFVLIQLIPLPTALFEQIAYSSSIWADFGHPTNTISVDIGQTQVHLLKGIAYTTFVWLLIKMVDTEEKLLQLAYAVFLAGLIQASYACIENLLSWETGLVFDIANSDRADGSFIYHNHLANYVLLTASIGIGLLIGQFKNKELRGRSKTLMARTANFLLSNKFIIRGGLVVMIIALILTKSRMGNAGFFAAIAMVSVYALFFYKGRPKAFTFLIISFFVLDLIIVGTVFGVDKVKQRMQETSFASEARDDVVIDGLNMLENTPALGTGAGTFYSTFPMFQSYVYHAFYDHAHNDYLQFVMEFGWGFSIVALILIFHALWQALKSVRFTKGRKLKALSFGSATAIIGMLFHSTVDFSLQAPANAIIFLTILVISWKSYARLKELNS